MKAKVLLEFECQFFTYHFHVVPGDIVEVDEMLAAFDSEPTLEEWEQFWNGAVEDAPPAPTYKKFVTGAKIKAGQAVFIVAGQAYPFTPIDITIEED